MKPLPHIDALARWPNGSRNTLIDYLRAESRLPGPRANLELAYAAMEIVACDDAIALTETPLDADLTTEFVVTVGAMGLGRCIAEGNLELLPRLRALAASPNWRVREGVAMALQRIGDGNPRDLATLALEWASSSDHLVQRAAAAGIAEPRLLKGDLQLARDALQVMETITRSMVAAPDAKSDSFVALRKAMGYAWSVAIVAAPSEGKPLFEKWASSDDKQIHWLVAENLKKDRLKRLDAAWVQRLTSTL